VIINTRQGPQEPLGSEGSEAPAWQKIMEAMRVLQEVNKE